FPRVEARFSWRISNASLKGSEFCTRAASIMGNGPRFDAANSGLFPRPLPIIGVRRAMAQCGAHDDHCAQPAVILACVSRGDGLGLSAAPQPREGVFSGAPGGGGFVDSRAKMPMPSASNRSTGVWTLADSYGLPARAIRAPVGTVRAQPVTGWPSSHLRRIAL